MNSKYISTVFAASVLAVIFSGFNGTENGVSSTGAPANHTGAPGENTCTKSGCHSDGILNSGTAISTLTIGNSITEYQPGATYDLSVLITDPAVVRFGYELTAIVDSDSSFAGDFTVTDLDRTQILPGTNEFVGRKYLTYTYNGTEPTNPGEGEWMAQWTAPSVDVGPVTFYLASVAANNDFTDDGDDVYFSQYQLTAGAVLAIGDIGSDEKGFSISVVDRTIFISGSEENRIQSYEIYNIEGKTVAQSTVNSVNQSIRLSGNIPSGMYFIGVNIHTNNPQVKKVVIK
ncbi:MAG: T9SS type A sorting domain-containing protein [Flavobacteriales bacterium]|nr:T9SS type A sorting domain-containing protein [Flavobacteriales bacterium]